MEGCSAATAITNLPCRRKKNDKRGEVNGRQHFPGGKQRLRAALIQPSALVKLLPFWSSAHLASIKLHITYHSLCRLGGSFFLLTIHSGWMKGGGTALNYLKIFTWLHNTTLCAVLYVLRDHCLALCGTDARFHYFLFCPRWLMILASFTGATQIWILTQSRAGLVSVSNTTLLHNSVPAGLNNKGWTGEKRYAKQSAFQIGSSHSLWHVWVSHKALKTCLMT